MKLPGRRGVIYLVVVLVLTAFVYYPITRNYFRRDDFLNLERVIDDPPLQWIFMPWGGHLLAFRNALFSLFHAAFGLHPELWFRAVLATHLVNVALLFTVIQRLTGNPRLGGFGALAWGASPVNEGSLGFYSVYGHVVLGTIVLIVLYRVARRFGDPAPLRLGEACVWYLLMLLGSVTFGVGLGIALVFPLAVSLLFSRRRASTGVRVLFASLPLLCIVGYRAAFILYSAAYGGRHDASMVMSFALASYVRLDIAMLLHLLVVGTTAVVTGFASPLRTYPAVGAYAVAVGFLGFLLVVLITAPAPTRRLIVALVLLTTGAYGIIAAGRAALFAQSLPAYGAALSRYHYVGAMFIAILLGVLLGAIRDQDFSRRWSADVWLGMWMALTVLLPAWRGWTIDHFTSDRNTVEATVRAMARAIEETPGTGPVYLPNDHARLAAVLGPLFVGQSALYAIYLRDERPRPVYFVEPEESVRALATPGGRLAASLVASP